MHLLSSNVILFCTFFASMQRIFYCFHDELCIESRETIKDVQSCPKTKSMWKEQERKKNCATIQHECSGKLAYHCLINSWQNTTLEVCAPITEINAGFCAEYNIQGGRIQDYFESTCFECVQNYLSTDAYLYQECYDVVYDRRNRYTDITIKSGLNTKSDATTTQPIKYFWIFCSQLFILRRIS